MPIYLIRFIGRWVREGDIAARTKTTADHFWLFGDLYRSVCKRSGPAKILTSVLVEQGMNGQRKAVMAMIVFSKNRSTRRWLVLVFSDFSFAVERIRGILAACLILSVTLFGKSQMFLESMFADRCHHKLNSILSKFAFCVIGFFIYDTNE